MKRQDVRNREPEAVRTTIVGGRPPGRGKEVGDIPRGIEVLVKKASVDGAFRRLLMERRARAAGEIGLKLEASEVAMLNAAPAAQLEAIIDGTKVSSKQRAVFVGKAAALMLAALTTLGCGDDNVQTKGIQPDPPPAKQQEKQSQEQPSKENLPTQRVAGVRPEKLAANAPAAPTEVAGLMAFPVQPKSPPDAQPAEEPKPKVEDRIIRGIRPIRGTRPARPEENEQE